jgi:predicted nucleic acid-binding protein
MASILTLPPAKVFIDSSVLIAAAISFRGSARELLNAGIVGDYQLFASQLVLTECERNIQKSLATGPKPTSISRRYPRYQQFTNAADYPRAPQA